MTANPEATELREKGNECVRAGNFAEAVLHYSHAIKLDRSSPQLYSNRSFAFLKLQQYYHALQDANEAIRLDPTWAKGYYRRGEVEFSTHLFGDALESYRRASQLQNDPTLLECVLKAGRELTRQEKIDKQTPWVGAGIGLILGVLVVVGDAALANEPTLTHPVLQSLLTMVFSVLGLGLGYCYRAYVQNTRNALLERPLDLLGLDEDSDTRNGGPGEPGVEGATQEGEEKRHHHPRYNKAQARQRYKKGKS